jgi:hypothetical protein
MAPRPARLVHTPGTIHPLQRTMGNQAWLRVLQGKAKSDAAARNGAGTHSGFSPAPVRSDAAVGIQPKLTINTPGDIHEQEADRVAEQVMRMSKPGLQRTCACGECPACRTAPGVHTHVQTTHMETNGPAEAGVRPIVHEALRSPGQPLDTATRTFMEPRFGHDFSQVRIHADTRADQASRDIHARAFTFGRDIVFRQGEYDPGSDKGRRLLAHELTHTLQQNGGPETDRIQRQPQPPEKKSPGLDPTSNPAQGETDRAKRQGEEAAKALAPPKLSKKNVTTAAGSDCGGFGWQVRWELDKNTAKGGFIVQKVELVFEVKDCNDKALDPAKSPGLQPSWYPIWEAWEVHKGQNVTIYAELGLDHDDGFGSNPPGTGTKGSVTVKGTVEFYDGLTLPPSFKATHQPPAGDLPMTKSDPKLAGGTGPIAHELKATWDCCSKDKGATKKTTVTPV